MDPDADKVSHENVAFRMLHSLTNRTSPASSPDDKETGEPS